MTAGDALRDTTSPPTSWVWWQPGATSVGTFPAFGSCDHRGLYSLDGGLDGV
jgi:hypothetical protein